MSEITDTLEQAIDRVQDFEEVQAGATQREKLDAVLCLQEAVELGDRSREIIRERLGNFERSRHTGQILYGIIIGLLAAQLDGECQEAARAGV